MYPNPDAIKAYAREILQQAGIEPTDDKIADVAEDLQATAALAIVESLPEEMALEFERWAERDDATEAELDELLEQSGIDTAKIARKAMLRYKDELIKSGKEAQNA